MKVRYGYSTSNNSDSLSPTIDNKRLCTTRLFGNLLVLFFCLHGENSQKPSGFKLFLNESRMIVSRLPQKIILTNEAGGLTLRYLKFVSMNVLRGV